MKLRTILCLSTLLLAVLCVADVPAVVTFFEGTPPYLFSASIDNKIMGLTVNTAPGETLHFHYPQCTFMVWTSCMFRNGSTEKNADEKLRAYELVTTSPRPVKVSIEMSKLGVHPRDYKRVDGMIAAGENVVTVVPVPEGTVGGMGALRFYPQKTKEGLDLKVHAIRKRVMRPAEKCFSVRVDTGTPIAALDSRTIRGARLVVRNMMETDQAVKVNVTFDNFNKKTFTRTCEITLPAGAETLLPLDITPKSFGVWRANVSLEGAGYTAQASTQFAYMAEILTHARIRPKDMTGHCIFGVVDATMFDYPAAVQDKYAEAAMLSGTTALRGGPSWYGLQPVAKDSPNLFDRFDALAEHFTRRGFALYPVLGEVPWADRKVPKGTPPDVKELADFSRMFAEHTRGKVAAYEVCNEVDNPSFWTGTAEQYIELFRATKKALNEGDPGTPVMNAGFTTTDLRAPEAIAMHKKVMAGIRDVVDIHAHHQHGPFRDFEPAMREGFFPLRKELKLESIPWFANETAIGCGIGREHEQAKHAFLKPIYCMGHGASGYFWYSIRNAGAGDENKYFQYGLTNFDFEPKPNLVALNTATRYLNDRKVQEELKRPQGEFAFVFAGKSDVLVGCWTTKLSAPVLLTVERADPAKPVTASEIDIYGNIKPVKVNGATASFRIEQDPKFVLITNAKRIISQK